MSDPTLPVPPQSDPAVEKARAEQAAFDALLADFSAKFPDAEVEALAYSGGRMIVRTPDAGTYAQFVSTTATDRAKTAQAMVTLCRRCILWPELPIVDALFARKPGLPSRIGDKLLDKAGAAEDVTLGK